MAVNLTGPMRLTKAVAPVIDVHSATTTGSDRRYELFVIVPGSGVGDLAAISGGGGMSVDEDDTHRVWFDYQLT